MKAKLVFPLFVVLAIVLTLVGGFSPPASARQASVPPSIAAPPPTISTAVAFDISLPLRQLAARHAASPSPALGAGELREVASRAEPPRLDQGFTGDGALQPNSPLAPAIDPPLLNFEGLSNTDNFNVLGVRVNPPSNSADVGPNHYVQMVNLTLAVYNKAGARILGPLALGSLWDGFAVPDCAGNSGDPIVLYDQLAGRWLLSQFDATDPPYYLCVAVSQTGDPTGAYYRYAFNSGSILPDFPKYGVWSNSYIVTTRDFNGGTYTGVSVYALQKSDMLAGDATPLFVHFTLDVSIVPTYLIGDGLLPPDIDGDVLPWLNAPAPILGVMDDGASYSAPFDGLNIFELYVNWGGPSGSLTLESQLPVAAFELDLPVCGDRLSRLPGAARHFQHQPVSGCAFLPPATAQPPPLSQPGRL